MTRYGQLAKAGEVSSVVRTDGILAARSETAANLILGGRQEALGSSGIALVADDIPNYGLNPNSFDTALQFERTGTPTIAPGYSNAGSFARADDVLAVRSNEVVLTKYKEKNSGLTPIFPYGGY